MKQLTKSALCLLLISLFALGLFGCGDTGTDTPEETIPTTTAAEVATTEAETESPYDENGFLKDDLPEDLNFNKEFTLLYWSDRTYEEFYVKEETGEAVNDSIFKRNAVVAERLGIEWKFVSTKGDSENYPDFVKMVEASKNSGDGTYDMIADHSYGIGYATIKGLTSNLMTLKYLDWDKPWWPENLIDQATINNKLYFASGDISANCIYMMYVTFFNRDMVTNYKLEDPYQLVSDNKWTLDKLFELCNGIYVDTDNSGSATQGDTYGMYAYKLHCDAFVTGSGISFLDTSNGEVKISETFTGEKMTDLINKLETFLYNHDSAWLITDKSNVTQYFANAKSVFWTDRCYNATLFRDSEIPYGVVPVPKYNEDQDRYYTVLGHGFSLYAIPTDAKDPDLSAAVMECDASESYRIVSPQLYEITLKYRFTDDATSAQMFDIIRDSVAFDLGRIFAQNYSFPFNLVGSTLLSNGKWASAVAGSSKTVWPKSLKNMMEVFN